MNQSSSKTKKIIKYLLISGAVLTIIGLFIYYYKQTRNTNEEYLYESAQRGDIEQTVSATGTVLPSSKISLSFKTEGTLEQIEVEVNDQVPKGQLLGKLDDRDLRIKVNEARAKLRAEQAKLDKLLSGATNEQIQIAEEEVNNAKINHQAKIIAHENLKKELEATEEKYKQDIVTAQDNLKNAQSKKQILSESEEKEIENLREAAINNIQIAYYQLNSVIDSINEILNDNLIKNNPVGGKNPDNYAAMKEIFNNARLRYAEFPSPSADLLNTDELIFERVDDYYQVFLNLDEAIAKFIQALTDTLPTQTLTSTIIDGFKTTLNTEQTLVAAQKTNLKTSKSNIIAKQQYYSQQQIASDIEIDAYKNALSTARNLLIQQQATATKSLEDSLAAINNALGTVKLAEKKLNELTAPAQIHDINLQKAALDQANANLELALNNLTFAEVRSPIDGIIVEIPFDLGEKISLNQIAFVMESIDKYELELDVSESDISKVKIGNKAEITFDAYGEDIPVRSEVLEIEPSETVIQDITYYKVTIPLQDLPIPIKSGLSADATIFTAQRKNVIYIPQRAVLIDEQGEKYVRVLENQGTNKQTITRKKITTGLKADAGLIEIPEGLKENEKVITLIKTNHK